ncbi:MAG TPA: hypothetical protein VJB94_00090 [Candidatus Nanoarchaeia archaeon]|nr:hypothetical protein [Candidatus Nanoarchaeia archaeon]
MNSLSIVKFLAFIIFILSILAMIGWIFDISILKALRPNWDTMKFPTALAFLMTSIVIITIPYYIRGNSSISRLLLPVCSMIIFLIVTPFMMPFLFGITPEQGQLVVKSTRDVIEPVYPGAPNYASIIAFIIIASVGFLTVINFDSFMKFMVAGCILSFIGLLGVLRYFFQNPPFLESLNGMAFRTALLILISGLCFILIYKYEKHNVKLLEY